MAVRPLPTQMSSASLLQARSAAARPAGPAAFASNPFGAPGSAGPASAAPPLSSAGGPPTGMPAQYVTATAVASAGAASAPPMAPAAPVQRTLNDYVQDFCSGGSRIATLAAQLPPSAASSAPAAAPVSAAHPLRRLKLLPGPAPAPFALAPAPATALPAPDHALHAARMSQYARILALVPPADDLRTRVPGAASVLAGSPMPLPHYVALQRARYAASIVTHDFLQAAEDTAVVLAVLLKLASGGSGSASSASSAGALGEALTLWLVLHAEALRNAGHSGEAVHILYMVLALCTGKITALEQPPQDGLAGTWAAVHTAPGAEGEGEGEGTEGAGASEQPIATRCLQYLAKHAATALPEACKPRLTCIAGVKAAETLARVGFNVAASNVFNEASAALKELSSNTTTTSSSGSEQDGVSGADFSAALLHAPAWVYAGLLCAAQCGHARATARDADAAAAVEALAHIPQWAAAVAAAEAAATGSDTTAAGISPLHLYLRAVDSLLRGTGEVKAGRLGEALLAFESGVLVAGALVGAQTAAAASAAAAPAADDGPTTAAFSPDQLVSACYALCVGIPEPSDLLVEAAVGAAECIRRLPPASTAVPGPGGAPPPPTPSPTQVSIGLLEACVRSSPSALLKPSLTLALTGLIESNRDAMLAALAKRVLQAVGNRYGCSHLEPAAFRLTA